MRIYLLVEAGNLGHGHGDPLQQTLGPRQRPGERGEVVRDRRIVLVLSEQLF